MQESDGREAMSTYRNDALIGRRALVTGGSRGIGEAIARRLAAMGASILLASNDEPGMQRVAAAIEQDGGKADHALIDLLDAEAIAQFAATAGVVDILVNNAAPGQGRDSFLATTDAAWDLQLDIILRGAVRLIQPIGRQMAERGSGAIVNISSMSVRDAAPFAAPYAAAKAGLEVVTRVAALELGPRGVRVNAIRPSFVPTERVAHLASDPEFLARAATQVPLGRLATADDMADAVGWLVSDAASFINGEVITVDGGMAAGHWRPAPAK